MVCNSRPRCCKYIVSSKLLDIAYDNNTYVLTYLVNLNNEDTVPVTITNTLVFLDSSTSVSVTNLGITGSIGPITQEDSDYIFTFPSINATPNYSFTYILSFSTDKQLKVIQDLLVVVGQCCKAKLCHRIEDSLTEQFNNVSIQGDLTVDGEINSNYMRNLQEQAQYTEDMTHINSVRVRHERTHTDILEEGRKYDFIVCGSGSGGGAAALTLAAEIPWFDKHVLVIEQGNTRYPHMYHEYPNINSANAYYGLHNIDETVFNDKNDFMAIAAFSEIEMRYDGTVSPFRKRTTSPRIFGGGSSINGGVLNSVPEERLIAFMPGINPSLFRQAGTWVHQRMGIPNNAYKLPVMKDIATAFKQLYGSDISDAYEKVGTAYTANAVIKQKEYNIESYDLAKENRIGYSFPVAGGFRSNAEITSITTALYRKRHGIAYLLESFKGANLHILIQTRVDRIVWDGLTGGIANVQNVDSMTGTVKAIGVEVTDLTMKQNGQSRNKTYTIGLNEGGEIFLAGNAFESPLMALRSGYGPLSELQKLETLGATGFKPYIVNENVGKNLASPPALRALAGAQQPAHIRLPINFNRYATNMINNPSGPGYILKPNYINESVTTNPKYKELPNSGRLPLGLTFYDNTGYTGTIEITDGCNREIITSPRYVSYMLGHINLSNVYLEYGTEASTFHDTVSTQVTFPGNYQQVKNLMEFQGRARYENRYTNSRQLSNQVIVETPSTFAIINPASTEINSLVPSGYVSLVDNEFITDAEDLYNTKFALGWFTIKNNMISMKDSAKHSYYALMFADNAYNYHLPSKLPFVIPSDTTDPLERAYLVATWGGSGPSGGPSSNTFYIFQGVRRNKLAVPVIDPKTGLSFVTTSFALQTSPYFVEEVIADKPAWLNAIDPVTKNFLTVNDVNLDPNYEKYLIGASGSTGNVEIYFEPGNNTLSNFTYNPTSIYASSKVFGCTGAKIVWRVLNTAGTAVNNSPTGTAIIQTQYGWKRDINYTILGTTGALNPTGVTTPQPLVNNSLLDDYVVYSSLDALHWSGSLAQAVDPYTFKLKNVDNVRAVCSSVINYTNTTNSQGTCMQLGRYISLLAIGDYPPDETVPVLSPTGTTVLFGLTGTAATMTANFTAVASSNNPADTPHTFSVITGLTGGNVIRAVGNASKTFNSFLRTNIDTYQNFILKCDFKVTRVTVSGFKWAVNSGVQIRSERLQNGVVTGLQSEIFDGEANTFNANSQIYYEGDGIPGFRGFVSRFVNGNKAIEVFLKENWNTMVIKCVGRFYKIWLNGVLCCQHEEPQYNYDNNLTKLTGFFALQNHAKNTATRLNHENSYIDYRNIQVEVLP
jgi:hypothetical protein